jgi:SAM-dependent MidA family methyltransferase
MTPAERAIRERIRARGSLTFADFMAIALHDPVVGYYARQPTPFGAEGDFYTSPELHPGFAALLLRQIEQLWQALDRPQPFIVLESGPGTGIFARDFLDWTRTTNSDLHAALQYRLDEPSPALRERQQNLLERAGHVDLAGWPLPTADSRQPTAHCIIANELLDALPVHMVQARGGRLEELFVVECDGCLTLEPGAPSTRALCAYFERLGLRPGDGCRAEVNLAALDWMRSASARLARGLLLVLDYGYPAEQLYQPSRRGGTLLCYYRHTLSSDPLARVGEQDVTTHVDFTSLRWSGETAGLGTLGLVSQQRFLKNLGWQELRRAVEAAPLSQRERVANLRALDELVRPDGLGRIGVLVQHRGLEGLAPIGLVGGHAQAWSRLPLRGPEHLDLPGPAQAEGLPDFEFQWSELWSEATRG